jgi:tetratricopeptide (TPR) repeat protein
LVYSMWHALEGSVDQLLALAERAYAVAPWHPDSIGLFAGALSRKGEIEKAERLLRELSDATAYGAPLGMAIYHDSRREFDQAADWLEKAIEQRDPNTLPASCGPHRSRYVANGRWPALARLLNLPETATGQPRI